MIADPDAIPRGTCLKCGLRGPHRSPDQCIDSLRSLVADLSFKADGRNRGPSKPIQRSRQLPPKLPTLSPSGCGE